MTARKLWTPDQAPPDVIAHPSRYTADVLSERTFTVESRMAVSKPIVGENYDLLMAMLQQQADKQAELVHTALGLSTGSRVEVEQHVFAVRFYRLDH